MKAAVRERYCAPEEVEVRELAGRRSRPRLHAPFSQVGEALRYQGEGHPRGKVVVTVD